MKLKRGQRAGDGGDFASFERFAAEVVRRLQHKHELRCSSDGVDKNSSSSSSSTNGSSSNSDLPRWDLLSAESQHLRPVFDACAPMHNAVVGVYALRTLIAAVVETLLLCDRALFLAELGMQVDVIPLFDPEVSSRNFALIATKRSSAGGENSDTSTGAG